MLTYRMVLEAPLVLSTAGGDPNAVETLRFVSGASILGAMARRFLESGASAASDNFRRLFLTGAARWLHAYPEGQKLERLAPVPRSLVLPKGEKNPVYDRTTGRDPERDAACKPVHDWFVAFGPDERELRHRKPACSARLHHTRKRDAGRPTEENIFTLVSMDAGERFIGHVLCEDGATASAVERLLGQGPLQLGRSRAATYGGEARVEAVTRTKAAGWPEVTPQEEELDEDHPVVVTLLSDYLGRDDHGQGSPRALLADLRSALGWSDEVKPIQEFLGSRPVSGYVTKWQMPRPRRTAVAAGSVLVFSGTPAPSAERLAELVWRGVGERRAEGFGRVVVSWHGSQDSLHVSELRTGRDARPASSPAPGPASSSLEMLRRNLVIDAVRAHLLRRGESDGGTVYPPPTAALVSRLRSRIRTANRPGEVQAFLRDIHGKKAGLSLDRARRGGSEPLAVWIERLLHMEGDAPAWWRIFELDKVTAPLGLDLGLLPREQRWSLVQGYLDALCEVLRRRAQDRVRSGEVR